MYFHDFIQTLYQHLDNLPGEEAHAAMAPYKRPSALEVKFKKEIIHPKISAVALLLYPKENDIRFVLTQRPEYDGTHSGQISFPGGKLEEQDPTLKHTALRETKEEIGVDEDQLNVLGELTQVYIPPSNFLVTPFLTYSDFTPKFSLNHEVMTIIEPSISDLMNDKNIISTKVNTKYGNFKVPAFNFNNHIVWGATALMLSEFKEVVKRFY
jgi:8-oxo-dGTP pyrophosphatase MutT (NUDIX family)